MSKVSVLLRSLPSVSLLYLLAAAQGCGGRTVSIVVFHTNDIHGWVLERQGEGGRTLGGVAGVAALVGAERRPKLLVDAGDWLQGTPEGALDGGRAVVRLLSAAGYDAAIPGNHELGKGLGGLESLAREAAFPVLAANLREASSGRPPPWLRRWVLKEVGGVRVGLFGLTTPRLGRLADPRRVRDLRVSDPFEEARLAVGELRAQGAQVVVALSHLGWEEDAPEGEAGDRALASRVAGIDLVIGGHTHTRLLPAWRDPNHGTLVVQAGRGLDRVGRVVLRVARVSGKVLGTQADLLIPGPVLDTGETGDVLREALRPLSEEARRWEAGELGTSATPLTRLRWAESPLGDWAADCLRSRAGTEVALVNSGSLREDLPEGRLTRRHLFSVMPFDDVLVRLELTGRELLDVLEHGLSGPQGYLQVSGLRLRHRSVGSGRRVRRVLVGEAPLDPGRRYRIATGDYLASGGEGYPHLGASRSRPTGEPVRAVLEACLRAQGEVPFPKLGRIEEE